MIVLRETNRHCLLNNQRYGPFFWHVAHADTPPNKIFSKTSKPLSISNLAKFLYNTYLPRKCWKREVCTLINIL